MTEYIKLADLQSLQFIWRKHKVVLSFKNGKRYSTRVIVDTNINHNLQISKKQLTTLVSIDKYKLHRSFLFLDFYSILINVIKFIKE